MDWEDNLDGLENMYGGGGPPPPSSPSDKGELVAAQQTADDKNAELKGEDQDADMRADGNGEGKTEDVDGNGGREEDGGDEGNGDGSGDGNGDGGGGNKGEGSKEGEEDGASVTESQPTEAGRPKNGCPLPPALLQAAGNAGGGHGEGKATPPGSLTAFDRARQIMLENKLKSVAAIKSRIGDDMMTYNAIRAGKKRAAVSTNLLGGPAYVQPLLEGLVDLGDVRALSGGMTIDITTRKIVSCSMDHEWKCVSCPHHQQRQALKIRGAADSSSQPQVIVVADQAFPACVPSPTQKDCIKIIIVEGGTIKELSDELISRVGNRRLPPNSLILMFSASCLADMGSAAYAKQLLFALRVLQDKFGKATKTLPLPPIFLGGCDQPATVRAAFELLTWAEAYYKDDQFMEETSKIARQIMMEAGSNLSTWELIKTQMPCKIHPTGMRTWASGGEDADRLPTAIRPLTGNTEKAYITTMIGEIRDKFALDLEPHPCFEKTMGSQSRPKRKVSFMVVGGSNAYRLSKALDEAGHSVCRIISTEWRISPESCTNMATTIGNAINDNDPATVVLQLLDSSMYYVRGADGTRELPRKGDDGKYHVRGELMVASYEQQTEHFHALKPILDVIGKRPCLIVAPMPRFIIDGCCKDARHVSNRLDPFFPRRSAGSAGGCEKASQKLYVQPQEGEHQDCGSGHGIERP
jgi:hypothetical protein